MRELRSLAMATLAMASPDAIKSAKIRMMEARKAFEDYENLEGTGPSPEHTRLIQAFTKATDYYLKLSRNQR